MSDQRTRCTLKRNFVSKVLLTKTMMQEMMARLQPAQGALNVSQIMLHELNETNAG